MRGSQVTTDVLCIDTLTEDDFLSFLCYQLKSFLSRPGVDIAGR
jgi:hypothetical protein